MIGIPQKDVETTTTMSVDVPMHQGPPSRPSEEHVTSTPPQSDGVVRQVGTSVKEVRTRTPLQSSLPSGSDEQGKAKPMEFHASEEVGKEVFCYTQNFDSVLVAGA